MGYVGTKPTDAPLTSAQLEDGLVTAAKIATDAVETAKVKDLNVTVAKLPAAVDISTKTVTLPATVAGLGTGINVTSQITGVVPTANLGSGSASASTYLAGNQTYQTITAYDDDALQNDIATLALHQATNANAAKYNLTNTNVDVYQDSTGVASFTDCARDTTGEYVSTIRGVDTYTTYTSSSGNFTVPTAVTSVEVLVVAGGGGGAAADGTSQGAGGGGAGGVVHNATLTTTPAGTIAYAVGAGGAGGTYSSRAGVIGSNSTFGSITALGGGLGAYYDSPGDGGSGGGSARGWAAYGSGTQGDSGGGTGYGNDGGASSYVNNGGGGGGAGAVGSNSSVDTTGGAGGAGRLFSNFTSYGVSGYFAGGGGGGGTVTGGTATHGGGAGGGNGDGTAGTANTGGGAGGAGNINDGGAGGSGFIGIFYQVDVEDATGNYVSTATTANASVSKVGIVITYKNESGTNTLNTDIVAQVSADGGSNYSTVTLAAAGTFSTGVLQAVANDVSVTAGTSIQYKISFANQSDGVKEARITGASLIY